MIDENQEVQIPQPSLILLIGAPGSGKTTFATWHFNETEILSSDRFRAMITDDENNVEVSAEAFEALFWFVEKRLKYGRRTVVDATNVRREWRAPLLEIAKRHSVPTIAIVLNLPLETCLKNNCKRPGRQVLDQVVEEMYADLQESLKGIETEGFEEVYIFTASEDIEKVTFRRI